MDCRYRVVQRKTTQVWEDVFINAMDGRPVLGVICTHMHPDHIGQAKHITDRFRCPLYMTQGEYFQLGLANGGSNSQLDGSVKNLCASWHVQDYHGEIGQNMGVSLV